MAERYAGPTEQQNMASGLCPECGCVVEWHNGAGGPRGCTLTDNGAAARIQQYRTDRLAAAVSPEPEKETRRD